MTSQATVIGLGNEFRRDDGVGPAVIAELRRIAPGCARLVVSGGDPTQLLDAWDGAELAIIVDALRCVPAEPGRLHRSTVDGYVGSATFGSTHGLGLPDTVRLAEALGRLPQRLLVHAVEVAELGPGPGLSAAVARAVPAVAAAVLEDLRAATGRVRTVATAPGLAG